LKTQISSTYLTSFHGLQGLQFNETMEESKDYRDRQEEYIGRVTAEETCELDDFSEYVPCENNSSKSESGLSGVQQSSVSHAEKSTSDMIWLWLSSDVIDLNEGWRKNSWI
jgi:hypothetical protein